MMSLLDRIQTDARTVHNVLYASSLAIPITAGIFHALGHEYTFSDFGEAVASGLPSLGIALYRGKEKGNKIDKPYRLPTHEFEDPTVYHIKRASIGSPILTTALYAGAYVATTLLK